MTGMVYVKGAVWGREFSHQPDTICDAHLFSCNFHRVYATSKEFMSCGPNQNARSRFV